MNARVGQPLYHAKVAEQWQFDPIYNRVTGLDNGNCRVTIAEKIHGATEEDWLENGRLIALAPLLADYLQEALLEWEYNSQYKGEYLQKKHGDIERIAEIRAALKAKEGE